MNLFVYGTLLEEKVWLSVAGKSYKSVSAKLYGYSCKKLKNRPYPGLIQEKGSTVNGIVYLNIAEKTISQLDIFEGVEYKRIKVTVDSLDNGEMICDTYLFKEEFSDLVLKKEWSLEEFKNIDMCHFLTDEF